MTTVGMVRGTPDWQLDKIYEDEVAQAWEDLNEPVPQPLAAFSFDSLNRAWAALETGRSDFEMLENHLAEALQRIEGTPESDKLASLYDALVDIRIEAMRIRDILKKESHNAYRRRVAG